MKYMLQNLGEKMTDAEFEELMKIAKVETRPDGRRLVDYVGKHIVCSLSHVPFWKYR